MPRGAKPGERRGGRSKGTPNRRTIGVQAAEAEAKSRIKVAEETEQPAAPAGPVFDSLRAKRQVIATLLSMASEENSKRDRGERYNPAWLRDCLEAADRAINGILPYEHRRLATLEPAMETVVGADGSVHVTISRGDAAL